MSGAVSFIGLLLLAHGVESNPGPVTGRRHLCISELSSALRALHDEMKDITRRWVALITRYTILCFVQVPKQAIHGLPCKRFTTLDDENAKRYEVFVGYNSRECLSFKGTTRAEISTHCPNEARLFLQKERTISLNNRNVLPPRKSDESSFYSNSYHCINFVLATAAPLTPSFNNKSYTSSNPTSSFHESTAVQPSDSHEQDASHSMVAISNSDREVPSVPVFQASLSLPAQSEGQVSLENSARGYTPNANRETNEVTHSYNGDQTRRIPGAAVKILLL